MLLLIFFICLFLIIVCLALVYAFVIHRQQQVASSYYPFAYLPEIDISQQPSFLSRKLQDRLLANKEIDPNINLIRGSYKRYPINKDIQLTSVVAVTPSLDDFPTLTAWDIEVDINSWNFVWCDSQSSYFVTAINVLTSPVVVIKGEFPECRYMSIYGYVGSERTKDGKMMFGQGFTSDGSRSCNSSEQSGPDACSGFRDYMIEPDVGSKNPFIDPTYKYGEPKFYTLYFVSPYYNGPLPKKTKNIVPLTLYGATTALILYRVYSPFNPKNCNSSWYWSQSYFNTRGCPNVHEQMLINPPFGGAVYPFLDKPNPTCQLGDKVCYNRCIAERLGQSKVDECHQYVGNNVYCICKRPTDPCYIELDAIVKACTNGLGDIDSFCASAPDREVSNCLDDISCDPDDKPCNDYVNRSTFQQCSAEELIKRTENTPCAIYNDPNKICEICPPRKPDGSIDRDTITKLANTPGTCQNAMQQSLEYCTQQGIPGYSSFNLVGFCNTRCNPDFPGTNEPPLKYQPKYDFNTVPTCDYSCLNNQCSKNKIPNSGTFIDKNCDGICTPSPTTPPPTRRPPRPTRKPRRNRGREGFEQSPMKTPRPCVFNKTDLQACAYDNQEYQDIDKIGINFTRASRLFRQGWIDLPSVFLKYTYVDYFVRLNTWNLQKMYRLSLVKILEPVISSALGAKVHPNNIIGLRKENPNEVREGFDFLDNFDKFSDCIASEQDDLEGCLANATTQSTGDDFPAPLTQQERQQDCQEWVDPSVYFYSGTQWPRTSKLKPFKPETDKTLPPYCNFYLDRCRCENNDRKANNCCETALGNLTCTGTPCFTKWSLPSLTFDGIAKPFLYSGNTGNVIPFPNPDISYLGCCTSYDPESIHVIWMDTPTFPQTPGFNNILKKDYDLRYFSLGHYYWNMDLQNQRPVQSDLTDAQFTYKQVKYVPVNNGTDAQEVTGRRICVVLCTLEQWEFLHLNELWDETRLSWLNWGKLPMLPREHTLLKKGQSLIDKTRNGSNPFDLNNRGKSIFNGDDGSMGLFKSDHIPKKGFIILRQLYPSTTFKEAISGFQNSKCIQEQIPVSDAYTTNNLIKPMDYPKFCNPGTGVINKFSSPDMIQKFGADKNVPVCDAYGFDPCCLCRDVLNHCKQYYPRCEQLRLCDIKNKGKSYWDRYFGQLPYTYE